MDRHETKSTWPAGMGLVIAILTLLLSCGQGAVETATTGRVAAQLETPVNISEEYARTEESVDLIPQTAFLKPAPLVMKPKSSVAQARATADSTTAFPVGKAARPPSIAFGLYTQLSKYADIPVFVVTYTGVECRSHRPARPDGQYPAVPTQTCTIHVVIKDSDHSLLNIAYVGESKSD